MAASSQVDTIPSPSSPTGIKPASRKFAEWYESGSGSKDGGATVVHPRGKPPRTGTSWRHGITNPRNADATAVNGSTTASLSSGMDNSVPFNGKPRTVRPRGASPRHRNRIRSVTNGSDTVSMASLHSEPHEPITDFSQGMSRKKLNVTTLGSLESIYNAPPIARTRPPAAFDLISGRNNSPLRSLRRIRASSEDPPESRHRLQPIKSPKGPRRLESLEPSPKPSKPLSLSFGVLDFEQKKIGPILSETHPNSNNLKGATTDWSLTKPDGTNGVHGSRSSAFRANEHAIGRQLEPIPTLQRSHTFDYGDKRHKKEPPSWQSKTVNSAGNRIEPKPPKPPSGGRHSQGRPSPKSNRRSQGGSRELVSLPPNIPAQVRGEPLSKSVAPGTVPRHSQYMYKMDKIASEASTEPQHVASNHTPKNVGDPHSDPVARFAAQFASSMPPSVSSRMSETSSLKDFELGQEMYTIAERSLENSRPTSAAGSTNSLEFLTSASMMNGVVVYPHFNADILAMQDFPGRDQAPKKSILKKNTLTGSVHSVDHHFLVVPSKTGLVLTPPSESGNIRAIHDDQSSVHSIITYTTDKKKVTWDF